MTSTESVCRKLSDREAGELRSKAANLVTRPRKIESNLSKDELKALDELKKDQDIRILPADKGRIVVVLDAAEYKQKCENLLKDTATYKNLGSKDPTSKYKKELVMFSKS